MVHPHCDIETGQIYDAPEGSWYFWHEKGHIEFNKNPATSRLIMFQSYIFLFWMLCITAGNKFLSWLTIAGYGAIYIYEEYWCNQYAREHLPKSLNT